MELLRVPPRAQPPAPLRYGFALGAVALALLLSLWLRPLVEPNPFIFFFAAVAASAWHGGLGAGLIATLGSLLTSNYFLIPPFGTFSFAGDNLLRSAVFVLVAATICALSEARRRAEARAYAQGERFRVTLSSIGDGVIATDAAGRVTFMNGVAETLTGRRFASAAGQNIADIFRIIDAATRQAIESPVARVLRSRQVVGLADHALLVAADGAERAIDDSAAPIADEQGQLVGAVLVFRDVTALRLALRAAERAAERTQRLQSVTAALAATLTPSQVADVVLTEGLSALGAQAGSIALLTDDDAELEVLGATGFSDALRRHWRRFPARGPYPIAEAIERRSPVVVESLEQWARRYPASVQTGEVAGYQALAIAPLVVDDRVSGALSVHFSDAREFSADDIAFLLNLAQQCAQALDRARLYAAERGAREAAEAAVRLRDQFLSVAAHELKTPLTSLQGNAQLFLRRAKREAHLSERDRRSVEVINEQVGRLNKMIAMLLDVSRMEMGRLLIEQAPLDLTELVRRAVFEARLTAEERAIELIAPDEPVVVAGDALRLEQVLQNLMQNALKYSPPDQPVSVTLARHAEHVAISVQDRGIGIPPAALPNLFQRFFRADNAGERNVGGLGIGLYVVKEIVSLHDGEVAVESQENVGSTFTIRLPRPDS